MINKLKSTSGESIAETLVAVLIIALALLMLAGTINTASNLITQSQGKLKEYYKENNNLVNKTSSDVVTPGEASIEIIPASGTTSDVSQTFSTEAYYELESNIGGGKTLITFG